MQQLSSIGFLSSTARCTVTKGGWHVMPGKTACLECIYPHSPPQEVFPVLSTTPGVIGLLQATEAIKSLTGTGEVLENEMLIYDGQTMSFDKVKVSRNPQCNSCAALGPKS